MDLTRRTFTQGATAMAGSVAGSPSAAIGMIPAVPSADDAYEALLSSYIAAEEQALASGLGQSRSHGAHSARGRQIEAYLAKLDLRIDPLTTARQVLTDFKSHMTQPPETVQASTRRAPPQVRELQADPCHSETANSAPADHDASVPANEPEQNPPAD